MLGVVVLDRRTFVFASVAFAGTVSAFPIQPSPQRFERIRSRLGPGTRLGVAIRDTLSDRVVGYDTDGRYPLASTFKLPLVAAILSEVEQGARSLSSEISFGPADLLDHAPIVRRHLRRGRMSLRRLCGAALSHADNSAANLLLRELGGPPAFNAFLRRCGDSVTRLDRYEPELNHVSPGDERDSTTPAAMAALTENLLVGEALSHDSQSKILLWESSGAQALRDRLRADLPPQGDNALFASGHVVYLRERPLRHERTVVVSYMVAPQASPAARASAHHAVLRETGEILTPPPRNPDPIP